MARQGEGCTNLGDVLGAEHVGQRVAGTCGHGHAGPQRVEVLLQLCAGGIRAESLAWISILMDDDVAMNLLVCLLGTLKVPHAVLRCSLAPVALRR